jgi:hypothetical protein
MPEDVTDDGIVVRNPKRKPGGQPKERLVPRSHPMADEPCSYYATTVVRVITRRWLDVWT